MVWLEQISRYWPHLAAGFDFLAALLASVHALLHKRDSRAATLWLGLIWFLPAIGPILYLVLGVNRIRRRAVSLGVHKTIPGRIPKDLGEPPMASVGWHGLFERPAPVIARQEARPGQIQPGAM